MEQIAKQPVVARLALCDKAVRAHACADALAEFAGAVACAAG